MKILAVDPSLTATGMAALDLSTNTVTAWKCHRSKPMDGLKTLDLARRLSDLAFEVRTFCNTHGGLPVIEAQVGASMGRSSLSTTFKLGSAYGAVIGALPTKPLLLMPAEVKRRLCGKIGASKAECWEAVLAKGVTFPEEPGNNVANEAVCDAVCVAYAAIPEVRQLQQLGGMPA